MTYNAIAKMAQDTSLLLRITACASQEGSDAPEFFADSHRWQLAATPGWPEAYQFAIDSGVEDPGASETVITDPMILAAVQPMIEAETPDPAAGPDATV